MSLEVALQENTAAMIALTAALTAGIAGAKDAPRPTPAPKPAADKPKAPETKAEALSYEKDIKPLALKLATKLGRDPFIAFLGEFGVTKADQVPAEKLAEFKAAVEAKLAS